MLPKLKKHLLQCAAIATTSTPVSAVFELFVLKLAPPVAGRIRLYILMLILLGLGSVIALLRDASLRLTRPFLSGAASRITVHDLLFLILVNAVIVPAVYVLSGASWDQVIWATGLAVIISFFTGPLNGAAIDLFRALAGYPSARGFGQDGKQRPLLILGLVLLSAAVTLSLFALATAFARA